MKNIFCVVCGVLLGTLSAFGDGVGVLPLSGSDWRIHEDVDGRGAERGMPTADSSASGWIPASVPGNVQADVEAAHRLPPLWYGAINPDLYEVARKDWWYRKDFLVPETFAGQRLTLIFDGVDFDCEVWLNGRKIGVNAGMFRRFRLDVAEFAQPGKVNHLAVRIARMPEPLFPLLVKADGPGIGTSYPSGINLTRQTLKDLKSPTNWGWDWGVDIWTLGIWKDVRLVATGPARIDWSRVQTVLTNDFTEATVTASLEVDSLTDLPVTANFRISGNGQNPGTNIAAVLTKGANLIQAVLVLDKPALWWPNGQGTQPLYTLHAELQSPDGARVIDDVNTRFGVRDVQWVLTEGAPTNFVSRYQLIINGRPVRTMGSCLIPPDLLFGRMGPRTLNLIEHAKDLGANTLRLWGGGVILHDDAYDLADELGIMLVQELPLANCWPETNALFLANLDTTVRNIIKQVRNHPAIIEFDGGNEMRWNSLTKHPALQLLQQAVAEEDGRLIRATCPDLGATHGGWVFDLRKDCNDFDRRVSMRAGEFGAASPANLEVWYREIPPKSQWPIDGLDEPILIRKNVVQAVFSPVNWLRQDFLEDAFGPFDDLPEMVQAGQFVGAEGLRYETDAFRRKGRRIGGLTTWDFDEPWPNGAGSYLVDYDGRTLLNYDFLKDAIAPVSLSLKYDSIFYSPAEGVKAALYITSDAAQAREDLHWQWLARDRRGRVFARGQGAVPRIAPEEVSRLADLEFKPPVNTADGPLFVELQLRDSAGMLLTERIHIFGAQGAKAPLAGLLKKGLPDVDDDPQDLVLPVVDPPNGPRNLAFVGNGAKPATASSSRPESIHQPAGLNDGQYGNDHSWIGATSNASFQIDLGKVAEIGLFKVGRDRTGKWRDRRMTSLKIEVSTNGQDWQSVFDKQGLARLHGFDPATTLEIRIQPVRAQFVRGIVNPVGACLDEFEVYAPTGEIKSPLPQVSFNDGKVDVVRPVTRTTLQVSARPVRFAGEQELLELVATNTGPMTALFCEPHPLIEYRTDLFIENNHCFIPPGESRTITIRAARRPSGGLTLAQTGWRLTTWNTDDVVIEPDPEVLLAVGRRDAMCREYLGYFGETNADRRVILNGNRPNTAALPYLLDGRGGVQCEFQLGAAQTKRPARLRIHTADQAANAPTKVVITINGRRSEASLPVGLGIQKVDPAHLAFPAAVEFPVLAADLHAGKNTLEVRVEGGGWFTWDALDLVARDHQ